MPNSAIIFFSELLTSPTNILSLKATDNALYKGVVVGLLVKSKALGKVSFYSHISIKKTDAIIILGKMLANFGKTIIIINPNFICQLTPTKFIKYKCIQINSLRIRCNRRRYQLTINRPDFVHSMDAMIPHLAILKIHKLNQLSIKINLRFNVVSIHHNFS